MANKLPVPVNAEVNRIYFNTSITEAEILALIQNNLQYFFKASSIWRDTQEYALYIATNANNTTDAVKITYLVNVNTNEYFIILDGLLYNEDGSTINGVYTGNEFAIWGNIEVLNHYFNNNYNSRYSWYGWNPSHNLNNVYLNYINTPAEGHVNGGMNVEAFNNNATSFVWVEEPKQSLSDFLTNIANAIRTKKGTTAPINAQDFASEIASIETNTNNGSNENNNTNTTAHAPFILLNECTDSIGIAVKFHTPPTAEDDYDLFVDPTLFDGIKCRAGFTPSRQIYIWEVGHAWIAGMTLPLVQINGESHMCDDGFGAGGAASYGSPYVVELTEDLYSFVFVGAGDLSGGE